MIGAIKQALRNKRIDTTAPPMVGMDTPTFKVSQDTPLFRFYDPNALDFPRGQNPHVPNGPGGPQNFNADCARQPQAMWNRAPDGMSIRDYKILITGLSHV